MNPVDHNKSRPAIKALAFCALADLKVRVRITRWVEELRDEISAFYVDDQVIVISSVCPHFGGDFDFNSENCQLTCRWHGWKFDVRTGESLTQMKDYQPGSLLARILARRNQQPLGCFPYKGRLKRYRHKISNGQVEVFYG